MTSGTLYLIPSGLGAPEVAALLPERTRDAIWRLEYFVVENAKSARAFLKAAGYPSALQELQIEILDEHTPPAAVGALLAPLRLGRDGGLLSEAGAPSVADPGAALVRSAHAEGIRVVPLVGPSALLLALMACGLNGQRFSFRGYIPAQPAARVERLQELERTSEREDETQVFIEAPYRNDALLRSIVATCRDDTLLCVATDLTLDSESIEMRAIREWKSHQLSINRRPSVFLIYRAGGQKR